MGSAGDVSVLGRKSKKALTANKRPDEEPLFCLAGANDQALVALPDRILLIKTGLVAGASFGAKVTSFNYSDMRGIEVHKHMLAAHIEVSSAGYESHESKDPYKESNCLPCFSSDLPKYKPYLDRLSVMVTEAKAAPSSNGAGRVDLVAELERLAALRGAGALTDDEFNAAKGKLLS